MRVEVAPETHVGEFECWTWTGRRVLGFVGAVVACIADDVVDIFAVTIFDDRYGILQTRLDDVSVLTLF